MKYILSLVLLLTCSQALSEDCENFELSSLAVVKKDNSKEIENLISKGVEINYKRKCDGLAAIHFAAMQGSLENLKKLIELGADVNVLDAKGHSPLDFTSYRDKDFSKVLLDAGGERYKKWGNPTGSIFFEGTRVFNVAYFFAIFLVAFGGAKVIFKKTNARIVAFGVMGLSYLIFILIPLIDYGGFEGLVYIDAYQYLYALVPIVIGTMHSLPTGRNKLVERASATIVNFYMLGAGLGCLVLLVLLALTGETS